MIIIRKLFSSRKKNDEKKDKNNSVGLGAAGWTAGAALNVGTSLKYNKDRYNIDAEEEKLFEKMRKSAEKKGVKVSDKVTGLGSPAYDFINDEVLTDYSKKSSFLGHELGHRHYNKDKAKTIGDKIGKAAHKYYEKTGGARNHVILSPAAGIIAGIHSGKKRAEKEAKGEKESKFNRHKSWAIPLAVQAPALLAEGMASKHGYKLLKKSGAGKEGLKKAKKELTNALGTYMGLAGMNAGIGELSRGISYKKYKKKNEKKKKKEED